MPDPVTVTIAALAAIAAWLKYLHDVGEDAHQREEAERDKIRAAIEAIYTAASKTRAYVNQVTPPVGHGKAARDMNYEGELSNLWMQAGIRLSDIDFQLAQRCEVKSGYWSDPKGWSEAAIKFAGIELDEVFDRASKLRR
jgi:hypothetical protein